MRLEPATYSSVFRVAHDMREADFDEFRALSAADSRPELATELARRFAGRAGVYTAFGGPEPIAVGGLVEARPNVLTLLFFATDRLPTIGLRLTRFLKRSMFPSVRAAGCHRIECASLVSHHAAHAWIKVLGMVEEGPPMLGYGKNGEAYQQFAWVADACKAGARN